MAVLLIDLSAQIFIDPDCEIRQQLSLQQGLPIAQILLSVTKKTLKLVKVYKKKIKKSIK